MTFFLRQVFELIRLLHSEAGTHQIAAGFALGLILGFSPAFSLQTVVVVLLLLMFRIQIGAALMGAFFFGLAAWALDPLHDVAGRAILEAEALAPLFTTLYNMPLLPLTRFYNSVTMGAMVVSMALAPAVYVIARWLVDKYRLTVVAWLRSTRLYKAMRTTSLAKWYLRYKELYG